jgi:hypothetical protein
VPIADLASGLERLQPPGQAVGAEDPAPDGKVTRKPSALMAGSRDVGA